MSTVFDYSVSPTIVPHGSLLDSSIVELQLSVLNDTSNNVPCSSIVFVLPVGDGTGDLVAKDNAGSIAPSAAPGTSWSIKGNGDGSFTAKPNSGTTGLDAGDSIAFLLSNVKVNDRSGLAAITVWEGTQKPPAEGSIDIVKVTAGLAITSLTATPIEADPGSTVTLTWTTIGATTVSLSYPGFSNTVDLNGSATPTIEETTTYTLTAADVGGTSVSQQITVTVPAVEIVSFTSSAAQVPAGTAVELSWNIDNFSSATITYPPNGSVTCSSAQGSTSVTLVSPTTYTLEAVGVGGTTDSQSVEVEILPVSIVTFTATPSSPISLGTEVTLAWQTAQATSVTLNGSTVALSSTSTQVSPQDTTTYTLVAQGYGGPAQQAQTVTLNPVQITSFKAGPIVKGKQVLSWTTTEATSCTLNGKSVPVSVSNYSGMLPATLQANGPGGPVTRTIPARRETSLQGENA